MIRSSAADRPATLNLVEALPQGQFAPEGGEDVFRAMRGARIIRIGGTDEGDVEGGGLIIDYQPATGPAQRVVFAFTELGMYLEYSGPSRVSFRG